MSAAILKNSLVDLALLIAPELAAAPFYLLMAPPASYPAMELCAGLTTFGTDALIRDALIQSGEWRGPGVTVVLNTTATDVESLAGIVLHEVAHNLPAKPWPADREPSAAEKSHEAELVALWAVTPDSVFSLPPWHQHDWRFIRTCLHLRERARRCGLALPWPAINFAGPAYQLSAAWRYAKALGCEPEKLLECTFEEIEAVEPPAAFIALFEADKAEWWKWNLTPRGK